MKTVNMPKGVADKLPVVGGVAGAAKVATNLKTAGQDLMRGDIEGAKNELAQSGVRMVGAVAKTTGLPGVAVGLATDFAAGRIAKMKGRPDSSSPVAGIYSRVMGQTGQPDLEEAHSPDAPRPR